MIKTVSKATTQEITARVVDALEGLKAQDIQIIDVTPLTAITDVMVIASGTSARHVRSLASQVIDQAKEHQIKPVGVEGEDEGDWVLVDLGSVIVHAMQPRARAFYNLEGLWNPRVATAEPAVALSD
ncbi:MAG: ribosome silencing factor [Gammaproteobacteria bacterium]|nr:ribosome silencing factor [Gammaproteobacteria bacterium]